MKENTEELVSIEEFISDKRFLGNFFKKGIEDIYPFWLNALKEVSLDNKFKTLSENGYSSFKSEYVSGAVGGGKTWFGSILFSYYVYKIIVKGKPDCTDSLEKVELATNSELVATLISSSEWFKERLVAVDNCNIVFDTVLIKIIKNRLKLCGANIYGCFIDDSFRLLIDSQSLLKDAYYRIKSRFGDKGFVIATVPIEKKYRYGNAVDFNHLTNVPIWKMVKGSNRDRYFEDTFSVFVGSDAFISDKKIDIKDYIINVPANLREAFEMDLLFSIRDLAGFYNYTL